MGKHPYQDLPDTAYWQRSVANVPLAGLDPLLSFPFTVDQQCKIATAGSCFAQHLAKNLQQADYNFLVTESAPFFLDADEALENHYGVFSARFGNVYTCRQLLQLFQRAYGEFIPAESIWRRGDDFVDPFRPRIQPEGFVSAEECLADREQHFAAVREMFETLEVFVFTLGLTETWATNEDGAVLPLCPGVAGGCFDESRYQFLNTGVNENVQDLLCFIDRLRTVNAGAKVMLTVSPVPLVATFEPRHVLLSTTYSKSVLRVVCEEVTRSRSNVAYFPSYEIITGTYAKGQYFAENLRSVTGSGVEHVMRCFMQHCTDNAQVSRDETGSPTRKDEGADRFAVVENMLDVLCDEEALDDSL